MSMRVSEESFKNLVISTAGDRCADPCFVLVQIAGIPVLDVEATAGDVTCTAE